ncbi:MAG: restriction endonuclease subunit S [Clostridia bacterium]
MLNDVEWGDYRIGDLFEKIKTNNVLSNGVGDLPATTAILSNNQIGRYIDRKNATILKNVFSATANGFGKVFYQPNEFTVLQDSYAFKFKDNNINIEKIYAFIVATLNTIYSKYDWNNKSGWAKIENEYIKLPVKEGKIDFDFMEIFTNKLKCSPINVIEEYLLTSGLDNPNLTQDDFKFLNIKDGQEKIDLDELIKCSEWKQFKMEDLFEKVKTNKLPYKAKELPNNPTDTNPLPCLTSSFMNQGLNYYVPKENATILKNVISIPSNSDVYRAYYQSLDFTVLSDAYAIKWKNDNDEITGNQYLFLVSCINKFTDLPIYSYKNKLGGWNVVKNKNILLPVKDGKIDFDFMEKVVMILKKIIIKDVVLYIEDANNKNSMKFERMEK